MRSSSDMAWPVPEAILQQAILPAIARLHGEPLEALGGAAR